MDSDEDDIFEKSVFDDDSISKREVVWAPLKVEGNSENVMWPAKVTSVKSSEKVTVKMLGLQTRALTVEGCVPYVQNDQYEVISCLHCIYSPYPAVIQIKIDLS